MYNAQQCSSVGSPARARFELQGRRLYGVFCVRALRYDSPVQHAHERLYALSGLRSRPLMPAYQTLHAHVHSCTRPLCPLCSHAHVHSAHSAHVHALSHVHPVVTFPDALAFAASGLKPRSKTELN